MGKKSTMSFRHNQFGNVMMYVLGIAATTSVVVLSVLNYATSISDLTKDTRETTTEVLALSSVADYVAYGLRKRWCFTNTAIKQSDDECTLEAGYNSMRLLMSDETLKSLHEVLKVSGTPHSGKIRINRFTFDIGISQLGESHPLHTILNQVNINQYPRVTIEVERVDANKELKERYPTRGNQVMVNITASLMPSSVSGAPVTINDVIAVYPRELSSFTLIVPKNFMLNSDNSGNLSKGNLGLKAFSNYKAVGGPGLVFKGPVFVNRDIQLSEMNHKLNRDQQRYTPVTFAEKVYIGRGYVKRGDKRYSPATAGGLEDRFYTSDPTFGGFMKGIEVEGERDLGLNVFSSDGNTVTLPDTTSLDTCNRINLTMSELERTRGSFLVGRTISSKSSTSKEFRLGLTGVKQSYYSSKYSWNQFAVQGMKTRVEKNHNTDEFVKDPKLVSLNGQDLSMQGTIMEIFVDVDDSTDQEVRLQMGRNTKAILYPEVYRSESPLKNKIWSLKNGGGSTNGEIKSLEKEAKDIRDKKLPAEMKDLEDDAQDHPSVKAKAENLKKIDEEIVDRKKKVKDAKYDYDKAVSENKEDDELEDLKKKWDDYQGELDGFLAQRPKAESDLQKAIDSAKKNDPGLQKIAQDIEKLKKRMNEEIPNEISALGGQLQGEIKQAEDELKALQEFNADLQKNPVELEIAVTDHRQGGAVMPNFVDLKVSSQEVERLLPNMEFDLDIKVYDLGVMYEKNIRDWDPNLNCYWGYSCQQAKDKNEAALDDFKYLKTTLRLKVSSDGTQIINRNNDYGELTQMSPSRPSGLSGSSHIPDESSSLGRDVYNCNEGNVGEGSSVDVIAWGFDMSPSTQLSWGFTDQWPNKKRIVFNKSNAHNSPTFTVRSIVEECEIQESATFVAGFLSCDTLRIRSRSKPLRIVGTIMANKLIIHDDAYEQGIVWTNIYHPESVQLMRDKGLLAGHSGGQCKAMKQPIWHPYPNVRELTDFWMCNPVSLRRSADPFTWTTVDPDCGIPPDMESISTLCKHQPRRYLFKRLSRRYE